MNRLFFLIFFAISIGGYVTGCGNSSSLSSNTSANSIKSWDIVDLGLLPGSDYSAAYDVNDSGAVVGESGVSITGLQYGFHWESGTLTSAPGYGKDVARSINNDGVSVGIYLPLGGSFGFISQKNGNVSFVQPPQGWYQTELNCINNIGHTVGTGYRNALPSGNRGFLYDGANLTPIEPLSGDLETWAIALNDSDTVTGYSTANPNQAIGRGYIFKNGSVTEIGFLPGANNSYPEAINNQGVIVGISGGQAFRYSNGAMQALGFLRGDTYSIAHGINENGEIVGRSGNRAFLFRAGTMIDLSALPVVQQAGWSTLYEARAVNSSGQIVGKGVRNGSYHAFLLSPIH